AIPLAAINRRQATARVTVIQSAFAGEDGERRHAVGRRSRPSSPAPASPPPPAGFGRRRARPVRAGGGAPSWAGPAPRAPLPPALVPSYCVAYSSFLSCLR